MAKYPEALRKAQAEIDAIVGINRLPDFNDRPYLPYVNAIIKEMMRWQLVLPLGKRFFDVLKSSSACSSWQVLHTWLLRMMNMMDTSFRKVLLSSELHGTFFAYAKKLLVLERCV
jgi:Fe-S cluster biosynthesis and repair protein YggX